MPTAEFKSAATFPRLVLDDAIAGRVVDELRAMICGQRDDRWNKSNDTGIEVRWRWNWWSEYGIPYPARAIVRFFNSGLMLRELSRLTGIRKRPLKPTLAVQPAWFHGRRSSTLLAG